MGPGCALAAKAAVHSGRQIVQFSIGAEVLVAQRTFGTSVYPGSTWGRRVVRRPKRAESDYPTTGDRGPVLTLATLAEPPPFLLLSRPGLDSAETGPLQACYPS